MGLVTAKARLAKQGLIIPRLELVSGHMRWKDLPWERWFAG